MRERLFPSEGGQALLSGATARPQRFAEIFFRSDSGRLFRKKSITKSAVALPAGGTTANTITYAPIRIRCNSKAQEAEGAPHHPHGSRGRGGSLCCC